VVELSIHDRPRTYAERRAGANPVVGTRRLLWRVPDRLCFHFGVSGRYGKFYVTLGYICYGLEYIETMLMDIIDVCIVAKDARFFQ